MTYPRADDGSCRSAWRRGRVMNPSDWNIIVTALIDRHTDDQWQMITVTTHKASQWKRRGIPTIIHTVSAWWLATSSSPVGLYVWRSSLHADLNAPDVHRSVYNTRQFAEEDSRIDSEVRSEWARPPLYDLWAGEHETQLSYMYHTNPVGRKAGSN